MSLSDLINERKNRLNSCTTVFTKITGEKFIESVKEDGSVQMTPMPQTSEGYVIDTKPDLQVVKVLPMLLLGSQDVAADACILGMEGITDIISIGIKPSKQFKRIDYKMIDLLDVPESNLIETLKLTNTLIDSLLKSGRKILVHCNAGYSRAPAIVIGYLMYSQQLPYQEAYQLIAEKRAIRPNDGFIRQLHHYQKHILSHCTI